MGFILAGPGAKLSAPLSPVGNAVPGVPTAEGGDLVWFAGAPHLRNAEDGVPYATRWTFADKKGTAGAVPFLWSVGDQFLHIEIGVILVHAVKAFTLGENIGHQPDPVYLNQ